MQFRSRNIALLMLLAVFGLISGCHPKVDALAPEKELYVVYAVLHPDRDEQYIRVSKVFQLEGDAIAYAGTEDLSAKGLTVSVTGGDTTFTADLVTNQPKEPGVFFHEQAVYRIHTPPANRIMAGQRYELHIGKPDDPGFHITAYTDVPTKPRVISPGGVLYSLLEGHFSYNTVDFDDDQVVRFASGSGKGFELRIYVDFWDGQGVTTAQWGPTRIFREPQGCVENVALGRMCYEIAGGIVGVSLRKYVNAAPGPVAMLDSIRVAQTVDSLSNHVRVEVTSVDTFLSTFLHSNTPFGYGLNLLMDRREVSNISGENVGIFGSINTGFQYIYLGSCTRYQAGLSSTAPSFCE